MRPFTITLPFKRTLHLLDQDGIAPTGHLPAPGTFTLDGTTDRPPFYLLR